MRTKDIIGGTFIAIGALGAGPDGQEPSLAAAGAIITGLAILSYSRNKGLTVPGNTDGLPEKTITYHQALEQFLEGDGTYADIRKIPTPGQNTFKNQA